jgi:hypothetical protein
VVVSLLLPYILVMPRNGLLDWLSALMQISIAITILWLGWLVYSFFLPSGRSVEQGGFPAPAPTAV